MNVINIKGGTGGGKTTICKQLLELNGTNCEDIHKMTWEDDGQRVYATYLVNIGYILLGEYSLDKAMGGVDIYPSKVVAIKNAIKASIDEANEFYDDVYAIVFEGMVISTIKSTFYNYLLKLEEDYGIDPLFVILKTTPTGCMDRIANRPSKRVKKVPNFDNVAGKSAIVVRHAKTYNQKYVRYLDVENIAKDDMFLHFLGIIDDDDLLYDLGWDNIYVT